jgi:hypothetical protein
LVAGESGHLESPEGKLAGRSESTEDVCRQAQVEHNFEVGDLVFLRLHPYRQSSLKKSGAEKLEASLLWTIQGDQESQRGSI